MIRKKEISVLFLAGEISNLPGLVQPGQIEALMWDVSEAYLHICVMTCLFFLWVDLQGGEGGLPSVDTCAGHSGLLGKWGRCMKLVNAGWEKGRLDTWISFEEGSIGSKGQKSWGKTLKTDAVLDTAESFYVENCKKKTKLS